MSQGHQSVTDDDSEGKYEVGVGTLAIAIRLLLLGVWSPIFDSKEQSSRALKACLQDERLAGVDSAHPAPGAGRQIQQPARAEGGGGQHRGTGIISYFHPTFHYHPLASSLSTPMASLFSSDFVIIKNSTSCVVSQSLWAALQF